MTLDEAIEHAEWAAQNCEGECSEEHRQLAEWLRELRDKRADERSCAAIAAEAARQNRDLYAERAKLRDLVRKMRYGATWTREAREYIEAKMRELGIEV